MSKNKFIKLGVFSVTGLVVASGLFLTWQEYRTPATPLQTSNASQAEIEKGRYLIQMGDCSSCHTATNGALLAGGYSMATSFGTIFGSNITPSADFGIGRWTSDDFYRAITEGIAPPSRHLYPAMPYSYFNSTTREDSDAMYAYLMSIPAIDAPVPNNVLPFPFNQRAILIGWNMLFFDKTELPSASEGSSPEWQRGKYIVDTLGHCAMCHSPTGDFGELERDKILQGGQLGRFAAPNLTPEALSSRGWTQNDLSKYLSEGIATQGSAYSDMYMVINNSTRHMRQDDIHAITTYLMGEKPLAPKDIIVGQGSDTGHDLYLNMCSGCHNIDGTGKPNVAVSMVNNTTIRNEDSQNLITSILDGLPWQTFPNDERFEAMPSFSKDLNNDEISTLVNYLRVTWGGLPADVKPTDVQKLRQ